MSNVLNIGSCSMRDVLKCFALAWCWGMGMCVCKRICLWEWQSGLCREAKAGEPLELRDRFVDWERSVASCLGLEGMGWVCYFFVHTVSEVACLMGLYLSLLMSEKSRAVVVGDKCCIKRENRVTT
jgi:hypothetical protein